MLEHDEICELIPHAGDMCLLDSVQEWDESSITCISLAHHNKDNPLRNENGLPMSSLVEFGAQAMAIHGCLLAEKEDIGMVEGYLGALRDVQFSEGWLSDIEDALEIYAERLFADAGNMIYIMRIKAQGKILANGRATVISKFSERVNKI